MTRATISVAAVVVALGGIIGFAVPAHAQKLYESVRYASDSQPISNWVQYGPNGYPIARDASCPYYAGVRRSSKVWASTYGLDESLHTDFRMQFHTTYSIGVAAAKLAAKNAGIPMTCNDLNRFQDSTAIDARNAVACPVGTANRPARWCTLVNSYPNDAAINPSLDARCPGATGEAYWPTSWHEWHNLPDRVGDNARLYNVDVISQFASWLSSLGFSLNMPVYLDDVTIVGGVKNFDQSTAQPSYGNAWYGYGRVATTQANSLVVAWYDQAARKLGYDPIAHPVAAHNAVNNAIDAGRAPTANIMGWVGTRKQLYSQFVCTDAMAPRLRDVLDPGGIVSLAAIGEDLSGWVKNETGETLCQKVHEQPKFSGVASGACNNTFVGLLFAVVDNGNCMNLPDNPVAKLLNVNLGCNRDIHLARLFSQMKAMLGG